jgi:hypothetical protein
MPTVTASLSVEDAVNRRCGDLVELSHSIHAEPELAFAEHRSCAKTQALVAERGFEITAAPGGLDTAFRADFGSGPLVVGICAEYDALPEIGHAAGTTSSPHRPSAMRLALAEVPPALGPDRWPDRHRPRRQAAGAAAPLKAERSMTSRRSRWTLWPPLAGAVRVTVRYAGRESHAAVAPTLVSTPHAVTGRRW